MRARFVFSNVLICLTVLTSVFFGTVIAVDPMQQLQEGNRRFANNTSANTSLSQKEREKLATGQTPFATIVACSDSRVPPEIIFDQGAGDLFIVRLAGNTVDEFALASIEYGISYLRTPLLVVMGHANCGAVKAAFNLKEGEFSPKLTALLKNIEPAVKQAIDQNPGKSQEELVDIAIKLNAQNVLKEITDRVPAVKELKDKGKLSVNTGVFQFETGKVEWQSDEA
ncbi:MAG: carbonic anhydrase [Chlamydiales bacterium]|nr:carbonic anhydrase [Chlamydiales bacterium]